MPEEVRRFVHKSGFKDDVAWVEYYKNKDTLFVLDDGNKVMGSAYGLAGMENMVSSGDWIELKPFTIYEFPEQQIFEDKHRPCVRMALKPPSKKNANKL
jgi:hypothetical protein